MISQHEKFVLKLQIQVDGWVHSKKVCFEGCLCLHTTQCPRSLSSVSGTQSSPCSTRSDLAHCRFWLLFSNVARDHAAYAINWMRRWVKQVVQGVWVTYKVPRFAMSCEHHPWKSGRISRWNHVAFEINAVALVLRCEIKDIVAHNPATTTATATATVVCCLLAIVSGATREH